MSRALATAALLGLLAGTGRAGGPVDAGAPPDAAIADAAIADAPRPAPPAAVTAPIAVVGSPPPRRDPPPLHRRPLFWIGIASGGLALGALVYGVVWATHYTPRYAVVGF